jgi:tight adherence protein C
VSADFTWQLLAFRYAGAGALAFAVGSLVYGVASTATRESSRLGLRGLKRQKALQDNATWTTLEPLVRWIGLRVSGLPNDEQRAALDRQISLAGDFLGLTPDEYLALCVVSAFGMGIAGFVGGTFLDMAALMGIIGFLFGPAVPYLVVSGEAAERMKNVSRGLPYVIDLMALSMGAGQDFPGAIRQVVDKSSNPDDPIVEEFTLVLQTLSIGRTRKDALNEFAKRVPAVSVTEFVNALVQAEDRGNPVAEVLSIQAATSRLRRSVRAEELAAKAGVKIVGPLMLVFLACVALVLGPTMLTISDNL